MGRDLVSALGITVTFITGYLTSYGSYAWVVVLRCHVMTHHDCEIGKFNMDHGSWCMGCKEMGGYARGVGSGVTYKRYFDLPRSKQAADERILLLESQLVAARSEREEKEL
ncbi:hypothetical protein Tco_1113396 [Tanacetum coccineum]|uniref:Uncharacterized protein n=1 Tax=Tanacetum coccineum TaxID=301880 RepID=A0ABQ5IUT7_9ASTR